MTKQFFQKILFMFLIFVIRAMWLKIPLVLMTCVLTGQDGHFAKVDLPR